MNIDNYLEPNQTTDFRRNISPQNTKNYDMFTVEVGDTVILSGKNEDYIEATITAAVKQHFSGEIIKWIIEESGANRFPQGTTVSFTIPPRICNKH